MQLSSGKKNAPAAVEEERRPRAEAGSGGEMPAMPGCGARSDGMGSAAGRFRAGTAAGSS